MVLDSLLWCKWFSFLLSSFSVWELQMHFHNFYCQLSYWLLLTKPDLRCSYRCSYELDVQWMKLALSNRLTWGPPHPCTDEGGNWSSFQNTVFFYNVRWCVKFRISAIPSVIYYCQNHFELTLFVLLEWNSVCGKSQQYKADY